MLDHAVEAVEMIRGHVSDAGRERHPGIPWDDIVGMRNRVVHGYDEVDFDILWDVVELHLPPLIGELRRVLGPSP